jgi:hypothetical protein
MADWLMADWLGNVWSELWKGKWLFGSLARWLNGGASWLVGGMAEWLGDEGSPMGNRPLLGKRDANVRMVDYWLYGKFTVQTTAWL